jgi:hypothetical protein
MPLAVSPRVRRRMVGDPDPVLLATGTIEDATLASAKVVV